MGGRQNGLSPARPALEPDINLPADHTQPLTRFLQQLVVLLHIPEQLDLNTRIWTKE